MATLFLVRQPKYRSRCSQHACRSDRVGAGAGSDVDLAILSKVNVLDMEDSDGKGMSEEGAFQFSTHTHLRVEEHIPADVNALPSDL